jgi:ribosome maturation factor RimP
MSQGGSLADMKKLEQTIFSLAGPLVEEQDLELVDVELTKKGNLLWIRLFIDKAPKDESISAEELGNFNRAFDRLLEVNDDVPESYLLEVSSPGLNRRLKKTKHFKNCIGDKIKVKARKKIDGKKRFTGTLINADDIKIILEISGENISIPMDNIKKANLEYQFDKV